MKKAILSIIIAFFAVTISAQTVERVYISTDKDTYVSGDKVWCSVYCMDLTSGRSTLSSFSSTVYLELYSNDGVAQTAKIALVSGRGAGALELLPSLPTGNYRLVAYTSQNRNEVGFEPQGKILSIYNALSTDRVKDGVAMSEVSDQPLEVSSQESDSPLITLSVDRRVLQSDQEIPLSISNKSGESVTMNVSIYHQDLLSQLPSYNISMALPAMNDEMQHTFADNVVPDYEGEVISLNINNIKEGNVYISFPGKYNDYYVAPIGKDGSVSIVTPNIYGKRDMVCEIIASDLKSNWSFQMQDPFIRDVKRDIPVLTIDSDNEQLIANRGFSMQLGRRFDADTLYSHLPVRANTFMTDKNFVVYPLDNYTRFPLMKEVITEFVSEMRIRKVQKRPEFSVMSTKGGLSSFSQGYSLIMLDGVPVFDHQKILDYDPLLVKSIDIYTGVYSVGSLYYEGVANFVTYKGNMPGYTFGENTKIIPFVGALLPLAFTGEKIVAGGQYPDYRQTIYWHPIVDMEAGASFDFKCLIPQYKGTFEIVIEGMTASGKPIYYKSSFNVR